MCYLLDGLVILPDDTPIDLVRWENDYLDSWSAENQEADLSFKEPAHAPYQP